MGSERQESPTLTVDPSHQPVLRGHFHTPRYQMEMTRSTEFDHDIDSLPHSERLCLLKHS